MKPDFGIHIAPQLGFQFDYIKRVVQKVERLDFNLVTLGDHLVPGMTPEDLDCLETWTVAAALSEATSNIRIGTLTLCNSFRNPALIAKMAASLDVISNGRLLFGIGAGWKEHEYDAYGYPFPSGKIRLDQLEEAVQIIKRLWTEREATFKGKHYQIDSAFCSPKPIQKPHPPILVGGHGEKRTLKIVAEHADMCNFTFQVGQELDRLLDKLRGHCKKAGRDYDSVRKTFFALCMISEDQGEVDALIARGAESRGISFEENRKRLSDLPGAWIGTPEAVREKCEYLIQKGFSLFQIRFDFQREVDMARVFSKSVMSKV